MTCAALHNFIPAGLLTRSAQSCLRTTTLPSQAQGATLDLWALSVLFSLLKQHAHLSSLASNPAWGSPPPRSFP